MYRSTTTCRQFIAGYHQPDRDALKQKKKGICGIAAAVMMCFIVFATGASAVDFVFLTTTDFTTGSSSAVWLDGSFTTDDNVASLHSDAVSRYLDGRVYVVNRFGGDNIQVLDVANGFTTVKQFSVGNGADPHDIAVVDANKAYVARYNSTDLWIVDPAMGVQIGAIDLSEFSDDDGLPEMDQMVIVGERLFVTIQRLDRDNFFVPAGESYVAVVDIVADTLIDVDPVKPGKQAIELIGTNPFSEIQYDPLSQHLYVACTGFFGVLDGGVEVIDLATLESNGFIFTEVEAGGDISDAEIVSQQKGYAIISTASFDTELIEFSLQNGMKTATVFAPGGFVLNDVELSPQGLLFLADRTPTDPGVRVFDVDTNTEIGASPINVGLPPFDITFGQGQVPPPAALWQNYPNPFNPETTIPFSLKRGGTVQISVFDVSGRLVRRLLNEEKSPGPDTITWDGRDANGRPVPSGVYFLTLRAPGFESMRKLVIVR